MSHMILWEQTTDKEVEVKLKNLNYVYAEFSEGIFTAKVGQTILLPCSYDVKPRNKPVPICWGRGICPLRQCGEVVLRTDGWKVTYKKEERYQLKGDRHQGNVSLTIENVGEADRGPYCCRIEFTGLFNDQKTSLDLVVKPVETTTFRLQTQQTSRNAQSNTPMIQHCAL
ncbi:hepatitis A virus cellular receptor 2 [Gracilinanus agilis]|uniref:hepatitis A virus cellular receptor 2 n=1 Tax=Gracilinanus agilis TaxID=191870 RepID=UPI001CFE6584|nr:hepatitis A virus cellular receptor 2 [Gracilinanus agilis]